jgi:hypothetical protein
MTEVRWERYPSVAQLPHARSWLQLQGNLGLAQYLSNKKNSSIMRGRKGGGEDKEAIQVA